MAFFDLNSLALYALCTFTSTATSALGAAGGTLLLSFMPALVAPHLVIPLHGATQLVSNASRLLLDLSQVAWRRVMLPMAVGACMGAALGYRVLDGFDFTYLPLILGVFILIITWTPLVQKFSRVFKNMTLLGAVLASLSLFIGAIGNLIMPILLGLGYQKNQAIITQAAMMTMVHGLKLVSYGLIGFAFSQHVDTMAVMMAGSVTGSFLGKYLRGKVDERAGVLWIKWLTSAAAVYLLYTSVVHLR